jgi:quinol monooxygenase YgiN
MAPISVFAKFIPKDGQRDAVLGALETIAPVAAAEEGTLVYSFHLDTASDAVWLFELYADDDAFMTHSSSEAIGTLFATMGDLLGAPPELFITSPVAGAKGLPV